MNDESLDKNAKRALTDEEIASLLAGTTGKDKRKARDPNQPSSRLPEALYYFIFILVESLLLMGVWGFMRMGAEAVMKGPGLDDHDVGRWVTFNFKSMAEGVLALISSMPWVPALTVALACVVFVPGTARKRKRAATLVSTIIVAVFVLLIAMQFSEDMAKLTRGA